MNTQLLLFVVVAIFGTAFGENADPCTTPDGKAGTCVPLTSCAAVFQAVSESSRNNNSREFAVNSLCSSSAKTLVCCESPADVDLADYEMKALPDKSACGVMKESPRIYGGIVTELDEFPWVAALGYANKQTKEHEGIKCSGTVINSRYVLTSANCLGSRDSVLTEVWLGDWQLSTDPDCIGLSTNRECADPIQKIKVEELIPHVYYSRRRADQDIMLVRLEKEIKFSDFVRPICLPTPSGPEPEVGARLTAVGWGKTENNSLSDYKLKVALPVVSNEDCAEKYKITKAVVTSNQMCAGGEAGKDTCQGDSGGPLMQARQDKSTEQMQWYQEGISSRGIGCGREGYPAIYTRVSHYMKWITSVIAE